MFNKIFAISTLMLACICAVAQQMSADEPIYLKTDRSNYISGDDLLFCIYLYDGTINDTVPGTDVYIDITDIGNQFITGTIAKQSNGVASGLLNLPDSLSTAYYKVRAYTRYPNIDNYYSIKEVFVSNRFGKATAQLAKSRTDTARHTSTEHIISIDKSEYRTREKVHMTLSYPEYAKTMVRIVSKKQWQEETEPTIGKCDALKIEEGYTPLTPYNGIIVTGTVTDTASGKPIPNAIVMVSLQDSVVRLRYDITDSTGSFCVLLYNYLGTQQIFINAFNYLYEPYLNAKIELKSQHDLVITDHNVTPAYAETDSIELNKSIINKAFEIQQFAPIGIADRPDNTYDRFMVGTLRQVVNTEDFVEFENFREIVRETMPFVRIRKDNNGQTELRIVDERGIVKSRPLLLVDGVPLSNIDLLMDKGSSKIKRIDTQNAPRNFGNLNFSNGIVLVWTHALDFWQGCNAPGTFEFYVQNYQQPIATANKPETGDKVPNLQQVIYWNPNIDINGQIDLDATLSDENGDFVIDLFGIDNNGKYLRDFRLINVK